MTNRIIAVLTAFVITFSTVPVAGAEYVNTSVGFWDSTLHRFVNGMSFLGASGTTAAILGQFVGSVCTLTSDGYHRTDSLEGCTTGEDDHGLYANATCKYCNSMFKCYSSDLKLAYEKQVEELPVTGYDSEGNLVWYPTFDDLYGSPSTMQIYGWHSAYGSTSFSVDLPFSSVVQKKYTYAMGSDRRTISVDWYSSGEIGLGSISVYRYKFVAPISGLYTVHTDGADYAVRCTYQTSNGIAGETVYYGSSIGKHVVQGDGISIPDNGLAVNTQCTYVSGVQQLPVYTVVPDAVGGGPDYTTIYDQSTRMGNVQLDLGTKNEDNSVTNVTNNYIVNETTNTYTNPATGEQKTIKNWSYDYGDRSYDLTFEGGDKTTVTYGDENVSITENTTNETGDTITNNYTVYYVVSNETTGPEPSPSPSVEPSPSAAPAGPAVPPSGASRVFQRYPAVISQPYGVDGHGGTDCVPSSGAADTVIAHSEGTVVWVQTGQENNQGATGDASYGNAVKIQHPNGYYTLYAHLADVKVTNGQQVTKGQALGLMGDTGNSYGAHLHFEVRDASDTKINSDPYLFADLPGLPTDTSWWANAMGRLGDVLGASFVGEIFATVGNAFGTLWGWLPPEIVTVFVIGVTFLVAAAVMKFFL